MAKIKKKVTQKKTTNVTSHAKKKANKNRKSMRKKRTKGNYNVDSLKEALSVVKEGTSLREAANTFEVPKSTLFRKLKSSAPVDKSRKGAPTILSSTEEEETVPWILYCAERGFPVNKKQLLDTVKKYIINAGRDNRFKDDRPGEKWYKIFMKRHTNLSIRTAQSLTTSRASVSETDLRPWFANLKLYLEKKI